MFDFLQKPNNDQFHSEARQYSQYPDPRLLGIEVQQEVEDLILAFQGKRISDDGESIIDIPCSLKIINQEGAQLILGLYKTRMSVSNATTMFNSEKKLMQHCKTFAENINELICSRHKDFDISEDFFDIIIDTLADNFELFLRKSLGDKQRKYAFGVPNKDPEAEEPKAIL